MAFYPSVEQLAGQITDNKHFNEIINRQQRFFQINQYNIEKLYPEKAKKIYSQILYKYEVTKELKSIDNVWQQNQRRLFVWYMVLLTELHLLNHQRIEQIRWSELCPVFFGKSASFLEFQFANILKPKSKITWDQEEDKILLEAMSKQKAGKWNQVSKRIFYESHCRLFKSPKHCRQRWFNHLDQSKNRGSWTLNEDYIILRFILENGKRWANIVKLLQNTRTEHMIKNRYNSLTCKVKKNRKRREQETIQIVFKSVEAKIKNQRKANKMRLGDNQKKKSQIVQPQNALQIEVQKSHMSNKQNSNNNSTAKNGQIKIEEQVKINEISQLRGKEKQLQKSSQSENLISFLNFQRFPQDSMYLQACQFYYFYQPHAFMPVNSIYCPQQVYSMQNQ